MANKAQVLVKGKQAKVIVVQRVNDMRLQFRGKIYEKPQSDWDVIEGKVGGVYRGKPWKVHCLKEEHRTCHKHSELIYRGVHYQQD